MCHPICIKLLHACWHGNTMASHKKKLNNIKCAKPLGYINADDFRMFVQKGYNAWYTAHPLHEYVIHLPYRLRMRSMHLRTNCLRDSCLLSAAIRLYVVMWCVNTMFCISTSILNMLYQLCSSSLVSYSVLSNQYSHYLSVFAIKCITVMP